MFYYEQLIAKKVITLVEIGTKVSRNKVKKIAENSIHIFGYVWALCFVYVLYSLPWYYLKQKNKYPQASIVFHLGEYIDIYGMNEPY